METADSTGWPHGPQPVRYLSDALWGKVAPLVRLYDPPRIRGRKRVDPRGIFDAIIYRLMTGCQWNRLPPGYPDDSSVHRTYLRWEKSGLLRRLIQTLGDEYERFRLIPTSGQSSDLAVSSSAFPADITASSAICS